LTLVGFSSRDRAPDRILDALRQVPIQGSLSKDLAVLQDVLKDCSDLVTREVQPQQGPRTCVLYIDGMVDNHLVDRDILKPLVLGKVIPNMDQVASGLTTMGDATVLQTLGDVVEHVLSGDAVLLIDGTPRALCYGVRSWPSRAVEEPSTEVTIRGPREGFVETIRLNTALLRRKIKSPALKMVTMSVGRITQTDLVVAYIEGLANPKVVQEVLSRLNRIDIDGVLEGGQLEELIQDSPFSLFPQVQNTERPDTAAAQLLEGRVAILVDGTPFVLIVPVVFIQFLQASEDYYERFWISSTLRLLRYLFMGLALVLPSLYIAVVSFHIEMLPSSLLLSLQVGREGVPFPALVEALLIEVTFEILREAGVRLPRPVGSAIAIVGGLVIGEAAVMAGLVSPIMVISVAITGIASFAIPKYNTAIAIRLLRFPMMIMAGSLGMLGIAAGLSAILLHLCSLRSFGTPYLSPVAPLNWSGMKDTLVRWPLFWSQRRPDVISKANPLRVRRGQRPGSHHGGRGS